MTRSQHVKHIVVVALAALGSVLIEALAPDGPLGHFHWAASALAVVAYAVRAFNLGAGPPAAAALLLIAALGCNGCKLFGPTPPPNTPGFVNCSDAALHAAALNILPSVETALATDSYEAALATLVASLAGPLALSEVECAVAWVANQAAMREQATGDPVEATKETHALAWLRAHPVTFAPAAP